MNNYPNRAFFLKCLNPIAFVVLAIMFLHAGWTPTTLALDNIDARQVAVNNAHLENGADMTAHITMTLLDERGTRRNRTLVTWQKNYIGLSKAVFFFLEPADLKGTGFLSWNYEDEHQEDAQWLYTPLLNKVRRIASGEKTDSFMGTDFSYSDMGDRDVDDYTYTHLPPEVLDGIECYHLEALPRDEEIQTETGYGRMEIWVRPDNWLIVKIVFYDTHLQRLKILTVMEIEQIDGIWTAKMVNMQNIQNNHQTTITFSDIHYNTGLDDGLFSQRRLTRGSP